MRPARGLLVMAIVAALWGAPSSVSAAASELSAPQVSPTSGSLTTVFSFRVRYDGAFAATSVTVSVAGLTVPMALESGSLTAGWWSGSTRLPEGTWPTTFRATPAQGKAPSVSGPVVSVGPAKPSPTPSDAAPPSSGTAPESAPADGLDSPTAPPAAPAPSPEEATAEVLAGPAAPGTDPAGGGSEGANAPSQDGGEGTPASGSTGEGGERDDSAATAPGAPAASPRSITAPGTDPALVEPASDTDRSNDRLRTDAMVTNVLLVGLAGVASFAIIGTLLLVAGRRRERKPVASIATPSAVDDARLRRVARSSRQRIADDPIVAALGIDDEMAARRAIRRARRREAHPATPSTPSTPSTRRSRKS